eukprot:1186549-Prorocentrum_minimum.AAC.2
MASFAPRSVQDGIPVVLPPVAVDGWQPVGRPAVRQLARVLRVGHSPRGGGRVERGAEGGSFAHFGAKKHIAAVPAHIRGPPHRQSRQTEA